MLKKLVLGYSIDALMRAEVELIRSILRTSSIIKDKWVLGERGVCDAVLVKDSSTNIAPFTKSEATQTIYVRRRGESNQGFVFFKPLRADELIKILVQIQTGVAAAKSQEVNWIDMLPNAIFKLKKWPTAELLSHDRRYTKLATYLLRNFKSVENLVALSGASKELCNQFLTLLDERKLLVVANNEELPAVEEKPMVSQRKDGGFISQLRKRFGLNARV